MPVIVSLYTFAELYVRVLDTAAHILTNGVEHAASLGVSETEMLNWRLVEDMSPLSFQLMTVANFTRTWPARVAGLPLPEGFTSDLDVAGFRAAIAEAKAYVQALTPAQFAGRDDVALTVQLGSGMEPTLPAGQWLSIFATTNVYFHLSMAYAILRAKGTPIGKIDLFAGGL